MAVVIVRKLNDAGEEKARYTGTVLHRGPHVLVLRTAWQWPPRDLGYVMLSPEDLWTETFYDDRWYNIFAIQAQNGRLKGWYCNITRPARISDASVVREDLALDLWVAPDGTVTVLDEVEFEELAISTEERRAALLALAELKSRIAERQTPFDRLAHHSHRRQTLTEASGI